MIRTKIPSVLLVYVVFQLYIVAKVSGDCSSAAGMFSNYTFKRINETYTGLVLPIIHVGEESWLFGVSKFNNQPTNQIQQNVLQSYFIFNVTTNSTLSITLNEPLDKEALIHKLHVDVESVTLNFTCTEVNKPVVSYVVQIGILPLNEFYPEFQHGPFNISIPENTSVGTTVFDLSQHVLDGDVPPDTPFEYKITKFSSPSLDGKDYFDIRLTSFGHIQLIKMIDFDELYRNPPTYRVLNITVQDTGGNMRSTLLTVHITDVDDQPPAFNYPSCESTSSCNSAIYKSSSYSSYRGPLTTTPRAISARDQDSLNSAIVYSILTVSDYPASFVINSTTGQVYQTGNVISTVGIQIKAEENSPNKHFAQATLLVYYANDSVVSPNLPTAGSPSASKMENSDGDFKMILVIVAVLALVIITVLIVAFLVYHRKQKKAISPEDHVSSETSTDTEEIHSESNKSMQWPPVKADSKQDLLESSSVKADSKQDLLSSSFNVATMPTPKGRGNELPPLALKDSSTETEAVVKKKRSRRRNKNKEPEIYDGTREYDMEADPEFFDSTDKSKIKRSSRSKDTKTDPKYWITVQNDF